MKCIGVLTSGGDAPGMNAAIRAVVRTGIYNGFKVMGIKRGYQGLIEGDIEEMNLSSVADIIHRGGTILRTSRSEEFETEEGLEKAISMLEVFGIDGLIILGGDGTLKGARALSRKGVPVVGIPCSIDNDCGFTDKTIGFMTAVETATEAISRIRDTSTSHGRANIIEVMGRHCGDIALYAGVAGGAESIIVPEIDVNIDGVAKKALQGKQRGKLHNIIIVAEGAGDVYEICKEIRKKTNIETRVTILGYTQRGGTPSIFDRVMASEMGHYAINLVSDGKSGLVLSYKNSEIVEQDIEEALEIEKVLNKEMYEMADILSI